MKYYYDTDTKTAYILRDEDSVTGSFIEIDQDKFSEINGHICAGGEIVVSETKQITVVPITMKINPEHIRNKRNQLLSSSDWVEFPSALQRLGEAKVQEWMEYRQKLRDITKQAGFPDNIEIPKRPE